MRKAMNEQWQNLLYVAYTKAQESRNPSTQNGAVLIDSKGAIVVKASNTLTPDGVQETEERLIKPLRYRFSIHAERNAIFQAAKQGIPTEGLTMICPWAACGDCAQGIIQSGIRRLVVHKQALERSGTWTEEVDFGFMMLREAGVEIITYDGNIGAGAVLRDGIRWEP